jgi:hypothetical protein
MQWRRSWWRPRFVRAVAWDALRGALRAAGASVMLALAVTGALAELTAGLERDGEGAPVACTQREFADAALLGRTAVVGALGALEAIDALERAARRGTWTDCRLLPAAFGCSPLLSATHSVSASGGHHDDRAGHAGPASAGVRGNVGGNVGGDLSGQAPAQGRAEVRTPAAPQPAFGRGGADVPRVPGSGDLPDEDRVTGSPSSLARTTAGDGMTLEVAGVSVPLAAGMTVQPPPGARLVIEVDERGRTFLRIGSSIRLGPLPGHP